VSPHLDADIGKLFESLARLLEVKTLKAQQTATRCHERNDSKQMTWHSGRADGLREAARLCHELAARWGDSGPAESPPELRGGSFPRSSALLRQATAADQTQAEEPSP
jgi:hypothetical protein